MEKKTEKKRSGRCQGGEIHKTQYWITEFERSVGYLSGDI